jgi:transmembrane sensor
MLHLVHSREDPAQPDLDEEAMAWVVRLTSGNSTPQDHEAFRAWRDTSIEHAEALDRARKVWTQLGTALPEVERKRTERLRQMPLRRLAIGFSIAATLALAVGLGVQYWRVWQFDYVTSPGETRTLALSDGSEVTMSGDTAINVSFSGDARKIELGRGEALFEVHHDQSRPFIVHAGTGEVRDVGTIFDVGLSGDLTKVVVKQGVVEASVGERRVLVTANQGMNFTALGLGPLRKVDAELATSWTHGWLTFSNSTLSEIVDQISPYYPGRIVLLNSQVSQRSLTAAIDLKRIDGWLDALQKTQGVHLSRVGNVTVLW